MRQNVFCTYMCMCGRFACVYRSEVNVRYLLHSLPYTLRRVPYCTWNSGFQLVSVIWVFSISASQRITGRLPGPFGFYVVPGHAESSLHACTINDLPAMTSPQSELEFLMLINIDP